MGPPRRRALQALRLPHPLRALPPRRPARPAPVGEVPGRQSEGRVRQRADDPCSAQYRMLLPLWRTSETYLTLRHTHDATSACTGNWRDRYRVGADHHALRPKRRGLEWQRLRAKAALLIEWLFICSREGWLAAPDRHTGAACDGGTTAVRRSARAQRLRPARCVRRSCSPPRPGSTDRPPGRPPDDDELASYRSRNRLRKSRSAENPRALPRIPVPKGIQALPAPGCTQNRTPERPETLWNQGFSRSELSVEPSGDGGNRTHVRNRAVTASTSVVRRSDLTSRSPRGRGSGEPAP